MDIDGDGDLDLALHGLQGLRLVENASPPARFARVRLAATRTQAHALGAEVRLRAGGVVRRDYVKMTDGFQTQVPLDLHFGLGSAGSIEELTVIWPSGATETWRDLECDRLLTVREGSQEVQAAELPRWPEETRPRAAPAFSFELAAERLDGGGRAPIAARGRPAVLNFWAPWCEGCARELPHLARLARRFGERVQFAGVTVETKDLDSVRAMAADLAIPYPQFVAREAVLESFFGAAGEAPLPATFVFDAGGKLRRAFLREVGEEEVASLLESLDEEDAFADDLAVRGVVAFEGGKIAEAAGWFRRAAAARPDVARFRNNLGVALGALGRHAEAALAFEKAAALDPDDPAVWFNLGAARHRSGDLARALAALDRAIAASPRSAAAHIEKGRVHARRKELRAARAAFEAALAIDPGRADALRELRALAARGGGN